jgi:type III pantothenate kinase
MSRSPLVTVDAGNTRTKLVWWSASGAQRRVSLVTRDLPGLDLVPDPAVPLVWVASVVPSTRGPLDQALGQAFPGAVVRYVSHTTPLPLALDYATPATLGADRIAAACGAYALAPDAPALLAVDAGTALTFEFVREGRYLGGAIASGPQVQLSALVSGTAQLPTVELDTHPAVLGTDTRSCIASGVWWTFVGGVEAMIQRYRALAGGELTVLLTGGWANLLAREVAVDYVEPDLVHHGLRVIAQHGEPAG